MKDIKGYIIIGLSIIISSLIVSLILFNKQTSSLEHCYEIVYKNTIEKNIEHNKNLPVSIYTNLNASKANAAEYARRRCLKS